MQLKTWFLIASFAAPAAASADLRHAWPMDERSGLVAADVVSGADGTLARFGNDDDSHWVEGHINGALSLATGSTLSNNVEVELPAMAASETGGFTIMMWINPGDILSGAGEYQLFTSPGDGVGFTIYHDTFDGIAHIRTLLFWDGELSHIVVGTTRLRPGSWYHVAVTSTGSGGERQLYVNGEVEVKRLFVSAGGADVGVADGWPAGRGRIGAFNGVGGRWHNSIIDDVRIYDAALTAEEIGEAMSGQLPYVPFSRGDANADGDMNIADAIFVLSYLFAAGPAPACEDAADANDDGLLNIGDAISALGHLFGDTVALPDPFGACGPDPTPEDPELGCARFDPCL